MDGAVAATATDDPLGLPAWLLARRPGGASSAAGELVRRELARDLHDQVVQELTSTLIDLENFKRLPFDERAVAVQVDQVQGSLRRTLRELRQMLYDLREEEGWQSGFVASLQDLARRYDERTGLRVSVVVMGDWPARIRSAAAQQLTRIIVEAVNNARLHGGAGAVSVCLHGDQDRAQVTITDDGSGLDPEGLASPGLGMLGMRERALLLGAEFGVDGAPGSGTTISIDFPRAAVA